MATTLQHEIQQLEDEIREKKQALARLRQQAPREIVSDYEFLDSQEKKVKLSELFGEKQELILIYNMGVNCSYCTLWADGFNGQHKHLENRAAFVVTSPNTPEQQQAFARSRDWGFRMVSSTAEFRQEMGFETESAEGKSVWPGVSVFVKDEQGQIQHATKALFGPGDSYCSTWDLFDLLPNGSADWQPRLKY